MRCIITIFLIFLLNIYSIAQTRLVTKTGSISFYSKTAIENINAHNNKVLAVWEIATGKIEFAVLMKGFEFKKALMQEHFNENYVESDKYPKATFKGIIENASTITLSEDKSYSLKVIGDLTIHGVTKQINTITIISVKKGTVSALANLSIFLSDYNIRIPKVVSDNINKKIDIVINIAAFKAI